MRYLQTPVIASVIRRWNLRVEDASGLEIPATEFYRGHTFREWLEIPDEYGDWKAQEWPCDGYRVVYVNFEERAIFSFVEGDLDLTVDADAKTFAARLEAAREFYEGKDSLGRKIHA